VIALVQEVTRDSVDKNAFQELDHIKLFEGVAKFVRRIDRADRVEDNVDMAFTAATSGRPGPAVLLLPADLLLEKAAAVSQRRAVLGTFPLDRTLADPARIEEAAALLAKAERPLIIAGGGVHISDAAQELAALQQDGHLPVATTFMGKGSVDETHPLSLGVVGNTMGRGARTHELKPMVTEADVVLLVGNRTNQNGTDSWTLYPRGARYIHIDPDSSEIGRNYEALRLTGDAKLTLAALREAVLRQDLSARAAARPKVEARIAKAVEGWQKLVAGVTTRDGGPVRPERVAAEIDKRLPADGIMVADASYSSNWINIYMTAKRAGQRFLSPRGLAGLGWGVPLAIGAQVAEPGKRVVCLVGDGGFGHSWAELETLRRLQVPVTVVVLNNGILGFQKHAEDAHHRLRLHRRGPCRHRPRLRHRRCAGGQSGGGWPGTEGRARQPQAGADRLHHRPRCQAAHHLLQRPFRGAVLMQALRKTAAGFGLELQEVPEAHPPGPGDVVLQVERVGICGSDVHAYEWTEGYGFMVPHLPVTMGHEFTGTVLRAGTGSGFRAGDRVAVMPGIACGACPSCRAQDERNCQRKQTVGLTLDGGFAGQLRLPARACIALPDGVDVEVGALTEPLGVGAQAVLTSDVGLGDTVLVLGPGTIGQAIALFARFAGAARVIIAGRGDAPRFDVLRQLGFTDLVDVADAPLADQVLALTGGRKVDVVLEATGIPASINDGLGLLKKGGVICAVGIHAAPLTLALTDFVRMRHQLRASHGADRNTWDRVLALLARDPEGFRPMITHRLPLARGIEGFELARQRAASKVMLQP